MKQNRSCQRWILLTWNSPEEISSHYSSDFSTITKHIHIDRTQKFFFSLFIFFSPSKNIKNIKRRQNQASIFASTSYSVPCSFQFSADEAIKLITLVIHSSVKNIIYYFVHRRFWCVVKWNFNIQGNGKSKNKKLFLKNSVFEVRFCFLFLVIVRRRLIFMHMVISTRDIAGQT